MKEILAETGATKINYEKLLNDWAEEIFRRADEAEERMSVAEIGSYKHGCSKGLGDGYRMAVAILTRMEQKRRVID